MNLTVVAIGREGHPSAFESCRRRHLRGFRAITFVAIGVVAACNRGIETRMNSAYALSHHPTPRNQDRIEALLKDPDRDVRTTALVVMSGLDKGRAARMAEVALADPDGLVRAAAVTIVAADADASKKAVLAGLAVEDPVWQVRARALESLTDTDDPAVREVYTRALSDPVRHVRRTALRAGIAHPGLLPLDRLSEIVVSDPDWENRADAARALGASEDPLAIPGLEASVADPNEFVRATAAAERRRLPAVAPPVAAPAPKPPEAPPAVP
jgi:HEAT repeat protein